MFDFKFDWDDSMSTGIESIDQQHKEFFRIGRAIEQLLLIQCEGINSEDILEMLCEVREYITYHFYTEENLIAEISPDELEQHRRSHDAFMEKINSINCIDLVNEPQVGFRQIKNTLQDWLFEHIVTEDFRALKIQ